MVSVCAQTTVKLLQLQGRTPLTPPKEWVNGNLLLPIHLNATNLGWKLRVGASISVSFYPDSSLPSFSSNVFHILYLKSLGLGIFVTHFVNGASFPIRFLWRAVNFWW